MEERFPTNSSILLRGPSGVGKFEYVMARIREDLRLGERVVFVSLDLHPNDVRARAKALRADLEPHEGKSFVFVDCYTASSAAARSRPRERRRSSYRASATSKASEWR